MDLVIDTSAIIAVVANEPERARLVQHTKGATLYAPGSVPWEVGNAFSAMLRRNLDQARKAIAAYRRIPIRYLDVHVKHALVFSEQLGIYAYDAYVLEAARQQRCPLLTLDRGLQHAARKAHIEVLAVSS